MSNFYDLLNVSRDATDEEIKKSYRQLSRRYHPDVTGDTNGHVYTLLNNAYAVLSDSSKRRTYDSTLSDSNGYNSYNSEESTSEHESKSSNSNNSSHYETTGIPPLTYDFTQYNWFNKDWGKKKESTYYSFRENIIYFLYSVAFLILMAANIFLGFPPSNIYAVIHLLGSLYISFLFFNITSTKIINLIILTAVQLISGYQIFIANLSDYNPFLWILITLGLGTIMFFSFNHKINAYYEREESHIPKEMIKNMTKGTIWGKPENTISYQAHNTYEVDQDLKSRQYTAEILEGLASIHGTKIFHEVLIDSENKHRTINHIAINKNKIIFIDSDMWAGGTYDFEDTNTIIRDYNGHRGYLSISLIDDIRDFTPLLPQHAQLRGYILIHPNNNVAIDIPESQTNTVRIANLDYFLKDAGEWFAENADGTIDRAIFAPIVRNLK